MVSDPLLNLAFDGFVRQVVRDSLHGLRGGTVELTLYRKDLPDAGIGPYTVHRSYRNPTKQRRPATDSLGPNAEANVWFWSDQPDEWPVEEEMRFQDIDGRTGVILFVYPKSIVGHTIAEGVLDVSGI